MLGKLDEFQMDALLRSEILGRIGCTKEDSPYVIPLTYAYDGKTLYCHTSEGKKIDLLRRNPSVRFQVDKVFDLKNWQSVIVNGEYKELRGSDADEAVQFFKRRLPPFPHGNISQSFTNMNLHKHKSGKTKTEVIFKIEIDSITGRFEKED